jgi:hypothetical protein
MLLRGNRGSNEAAYKQIRRGLRPRTHPRQLNLRAHNGDSQNNLEAPSLLVHTKMAESNQRLNLMPIVGEHMIRRRPAVRGVAPAFSGPAIPGD